MASLNSFALSFQRKKAIILFIFLHTKYAREYCGGVREP